MDYGLSDYYDDDVLKLRPAEELLASQLGAALGAPRANEHLQGQPAGHLAP